MNISKNRNVRIQILFNSVILFFVISSFVSISSIGDDPTIKNDNYPLTGRIKNFTPQNFSPQNIFKNLLSSENDNTGKQNILYGSPYFTDNFDGNNDTNSLISRGYKVYFRGTGLQNTSVPTWFQGNPLVFNSFNGPANGYVSGIYQVVTGVNNIDNWLVLPPKNISANDSMFFYQRSQFDPNYPDSIRVMYSAAGDSVPEALSWVELGRFRANFNSDAWVRSGFKAPNSGANARYAIRYSVVNSGPSGVNGNFIGIDGLSLESGAFPNDAGIQNVIAPAGIIALPSTPVTPSVTVKNFGTAPQTFNVTMLISPGGYSDTKTVNSISPNSSQNLNFNNFNPVSAGNFSVKVYTQLSGDDNPLNDTLNSSFSVMQPNYGGGGSGTGGYYFANSTVNAFPSPSYPVYSRADTSGSISLVLNNDVKVPLSRGDIDDGQWAFSGLGGSKKVKFMGAFYDSVFIGTNGIICFSDFIPDQSNWSPPLNGLPGSGSGGGCRPGLYPYWNDIDFGNTEQPFNRLSYKVDTNRNLLIVTYDKAPVFNGSDTEFETFQILIEFKENLPSSENSNIVFSYDNSSTTLNVPLLIGMQNATGSEFLQYSFINSGSVVITPGPVFDPSSTGVSISFGPEANKLLGNYKTLNLTALIQGFWDGVVNVSDTISVQLRQLISPYDIVEISQGVTDQSGNVQINFAHAVQGTAYYLTLKHRNSLETWSRSDGVIWDNLNYVSYNFTDSVTKAFGNNLILKSGKYCIWGGDVNQDEIVDAGDLSIVENSIGISGYVSADINGDDFVDAFDLSFVENNTADNPIVVKP
ncbi:MAG TPA: choice-of-anchor J domain-containing protein [Ignavibacteria bacterium]|nr:choice-of-anchor J domain-containing protein [Ignavibacteria bacterium]